MSTLTVPDEVVRVLQTNAAARGVTVEQLVAELVATLDSASAVDKPATQRRRLALSGIGRSGGGLTDRIDDMLADGFGRG